MSRAQPQDEATAAPAAKPLRLSVTALAGVKLVHPGDDLAAIVTDALAASGERLEDGDVLVLAQKIVSKAEGRTVHLGDVEPSPYARNSAAQWEKAPRLVEVVLRQTSRIVRNDRGVTPARPPPALA